MKTKVQKDILNYLEDTFINSSIILKIKDLDKYLNNSNFLNNQNYIISNKNRKKLLKKVEYKSEYRPKYSKIKKIEYPYLTYSNGDRYSRILNIGEFGILNNIGVKKATLNIVNLLSFLFNLLKLFSDLYLISL